MTNTRLVRFFGMLFLAGLIGLVWLHGSTLTPHARIAMLVSAFAGIGALAIAIYLDEGWGGGQFLVVLVICVIPMSIGCVALWAFTDYMETPLKIELTVIICISCLALVGQIALGHYGFFYVVWIANLVAGNSILWTTPGLHLTLWSMIAVSASSSVSVILATWGFMGEMEDKCPEEAEGFKDFWILCLAAGAALGVSVTAAGGVAIWDTHSPFSHLGIQHKIGLSLVVRI
jgi:hypothetical protein